jgi:hypothetical protein
VAYYPTEVPFHHRSRWLEGRDVLGEEASGFDLPRTNDPQNATRRAYLLWRQERLFELWQLWERTVRAVNPDSCVIPNTGGGATSALDMKRIGELAPTLMADRQARRGLAAPWANGKNGKEYRATMGSKPIVGIFSVGVEEPYRWKDSVQNDEEIRIWVADGVANGLRPWFTKFGAVLHDPRWLEPVAELYRRYAAWEPYSPVSGGNCDRNNGRDRRTPRIFFTAWSIDRRRSPCATRRS